MRPPSLFNCSTASVRSIAAMSTRTLTASTAWTGDVANDMIEIAAANAKRRTLKRQSSVPVSSPFTVQPNSVLSIGVSYQAQEMHVLGALPAYTFGAASYRG